MEPFEWTITETTQALTEQRVGAEELTQLMLTRIAQLNPTVHAFLAVSERALADAREIDRQRAAGATLGPLAGVPMAIKDLVDTDFLPTTYGGLHYAKHVPSQSATVVRRLQQAGAIVLGKTNLHEYAYGTTTENPHFGSCVNPWNRNKISGGSSGGSSVSIVSGLCTAALGSDTGGSIRIPASLTGHVGLKPTHGLVPTSGVFALAPTLDHVGPMTRTVHDAALLLNVLAGYDPRDVHSVRTPARDFTTGFLPQTIRIGVPKRYFYDKCQTTVLQTVTDALRRVERQCPDMAFVEVDVPGIEEVSVAQNAMIASEARASHDRQFRAEPELYGDDVRARLAYADEVPGYVYADAIAFRRRFQQSLHALFEQVDVLVTPTTPITATDLGQRKTHLRTLEVDIRSHLTRYTSPWNLSGLPAISIPCGLGADELPVGLQLVGSKFGDGRLLAIAKRFEAVLPWYSIAPDFRADRQ